MKDAVAIEYDTDVISDYVTRKQQCEYRDKTMKHQRENCEFLSTYHHYY